MSVTPCKRLATLGVSNSWEAASPKISVILLTSWSNTTRLPAFEKCNLSTNWARIRPFERVEQRMQVQHRRILGFCHVHADRCVSTSSNIAAVRITGALPASSIVHSRRCDHQDLGLGGTRAQAIQDLDQVGSILSACQAYCSQAWACLHCLCSIESLNPWLQCRQIADRSCLSSSQRPISCPCRTTAGHPRSGCGNVLLLLH